MDCNFISESLGSYLDKLSSKTPVPGGGSVAAVVASLSCSLIDMVLNYTLGKEKYKKFEDELLKIKNRNGEIKRDVSSFIEEDSRIYKRISENKNDREKQQFYLEKSMEIHRKICGYMEEVMNFSDFLAKNGNKYLISDAGIVALLANSAFKGAKINILINLKYFDEREKYKDVVKILEEKEKEMEKMEKAVYLYTTEKIGG